MRLQLKYQVLISWQLLLLLLLLKVKYLILVFQLKKNDYNTKINEIEKKITDHSHDKYITTQEFNKLTAKTFAARLAQANLVTKSDFDDKLTNLNKEINSNKTKHLIVENEFEKLETFDSIYFRGKSNFEDDGT